MSQGTDAPRLPLIPFQQAMLLWEQVHPYNAAHAICVDRPIDVVRLRQAIESVCREAGIGRLTIDRTRGTLAYEPWDGVDLHALPHAADPDGLLSQVMRDGINARFPDAPHHPLRWTVFPTTGGRAHYIVLAYRHVVSDGHGILALFAEILRRCTSTATTIDATHLTTRAPREARRWRRPGFAAALWRAFILSRRIRGAYRLPERDDAAGKTAVAIRSAPMGLLDRLTHSCRRRGVGLNDAFLAALAFTIARRAAGDCLDSQPMALGTVVSRRRDAHIELANFFGVRLHDLIVLIRRSGSDLERMLDEVARQTRRHKARPLASIAISSTRTMWVKHVWPLLRVRNERASYLKIFPVCAGVSTFVVDAARLASDAPVTRYVRAAPLGPAVSIVLAPTAFGDRLELTLSYRVTCLDGDGAQDVLSRVVMALEQLASNAADADRH